MAVFHKIGICHVENTRMRGYYKFLSAQACEEEQSCKSLCTSLKEEVSSQFTKDHYKKVQNSKAAHWERGLRSRELQVHSEERTDRYPGEEPGSGLQETAGRKQSKTGGEQEMTSNRQKLVIGRLEN